MAARPGQVYDEVAVEAPYPRDDAFRFVNGANSSSAIPLSPSRGEVILPLSKFTISDGQRYGLALRPVRIADGVPGDQRGWDLIKG